MTNYPSIYISPPLYVSIRSSSGQDEANILLAVKLEQHLSLWDREDLEVVFDFYSPNSLKYLPLPVERRESAKLKSKAYRQKECLSNAADGKYAEEDPRGDARFAAGNILPKPFISAMFSMACKWTHTDISRPLTPSLVLHTAHFPLLSLLYFHTFCF